MIRLAVLDEDVDRGKPRASGDDPSFKAYRDMEKR